MNVSIPLKQVDLKHFLEVCGDDEATMQELMVEITREIPVEMKKLNQASAQSDWEEVFQIAHKLKMTFSFLGNEELDKLVKVTEFSARHKIDVQEIPILVKEMTKITDLVMEELI